MRMMTEQVGEHHLLTFGPAHRILLDQAVVDPAKKYHEQIVECEINGVRVTIEIDISNVGYPLPVTITADSGKPFRVSWPDQGEDV